MLELNKIHNIDALEGLKQLDDNSIDLIATDPPYGYSFMGKDWDKVVVSQDRTAREKAAEEKTAKYQERVKKNMEKQ